jgi:hypothetical protein
MFDGDHFFIRDPQSEFGWCFQELVSRPSRQQLLRRNPKAVTYTLTLIVSVPASTRRSNRVMMTLIAQQASNIT